VLAALHESRERQAPYAGAFLLKDEPDSDPNVVSSSDTEKNVYDLKGKELFELIDSKVEKREVDLNEAIKYNLSIIESAPKPINRTEFLEDLDKLKFDELANKYIGE
jgi:cell fate regulator YaaT (PSP1 superfamily)